MRAWPQPELESPNRGNVTPKQGDGRIERAGADLERRYWLALALYVGLGLLVWFTMDAGKVMVFGKPVAMRLVPLVVIGGLVLRTVMARQAARIRRKDS